MYFFYDIVPIGQRIYKPYTYKYYKSLEIGQRVVIDLRGKFVPGMVYRQAESTFQDNIKIKDIEFPLDERSFLNEYHIKLLEKVCSYFIAPIGEIAKLLFPPSSSDVYKLRIIPKNPLAPYQKPVFYKEFLKRYLNSATANKELRNLLDSNLVTLEVYRKNTRELKDNFVVLNMDLKDIWKYNLSKTAREVVNFLSINGSVLESELYNKGVLKKGSTVLTTLVKKGIINITEKIEPKENSIEVSLSDEQLNSANFIKNNKDKPHLLYGITGSGKTEVFFEVSREILENGGKVLLLVPEISLTSELMNRLKKRFSNYKALFYHSSLTSSERVNTWYSAVNGDVDIIIGTRSAIWLPIKDLKMIIIDEEHDQSYYQIENVTYDAVETAIFRKEIENLQLILSSATPRVLDLYKVKNNSMYLETIKSRYFSEMPEVEIVDMKKEEKYNWIFSKKVIESIKEVLKKDRKAIIFTPTRGYANYIICSDCGYIFKCKNCDVSLTFHKKDRKLTCHYCGKESSIPNFCPKCGGFKLQSRGYGTERVIAELGKLFPSDPLVRVDRTVIKTFNDLNKTFNFMKEPGKKIIVGTRMITKGLDIQDLDLVIILDADRYSNLPDYNSEESTASLIMQVAGRSGRKEKGKVLIQTFEPDNEVYKAVQSHDYNLIAEKELEQRKFFKYPPFIDLYLIIVSDSKIEKVQSISEEIVKEIETQVDNKNLEILGPVTPVISKLRGNYRYQIIIKSYQEHLDFLPKVVEKYDKFIKLYVNPPTTII
ncbi:primosomal protein N' [Petrotoga sp. 9PWA.NaAc.5.4]|uniref:replication restart helicase PriA n=1 Tax=Petrotoga sp. 9PWA.NaAc.5.4 TaxID=1434328 RepID=UPI000CB000B0|nr:primosomal protein N' [Petrotoga sp. 9PWA.NaAc.5.4]PNR94671.1 hypothetical protein X924_06180 [Petrotoga sp. 9PWA.NaAc.5.4]